MTMPNEQDVVNSAQQRAGGRKPAMKQPSTQEWESFMANVYPEPNTGCWLFAGRRSGAGYSTVSVRAEDGSWRRERAHRFSYERLIGPIPDGLQLDHLCRVRNCVNPAHLEPVTNRENVLRGYGLTAQNARKTYCIQGHPYDTKNTGWRSGRRVCRACQKISRLKYHRLRLECAK